MNILFHIFRFPILVFVANAVLDAGGIYVVFPWVDIPMHFLGGVSIAVAGVCFLALLRGHGFINRLPLLFYALFIMSFVGLAAASWELWEFSLDRIFGGGAQVDLPDTMTDMFFGLLGGSVTIVLWFVLHKRRY